MRGNSGLTSFVIVIVIGCHFMPLFFLKSGTLILGFFGIIITDGGHTLGSLCLRSGFAPKSGDKEYSKWDETELNINYQIVG